MCKHGQNIKNIHWFFFQLHIKLYVFKDKLKKALISLQNKFKRNISKLILISSFHTQEKIRKLCNSLN